MDIRYQYSNFHTIYQVYIEKKVLRMILKEK